MISNRRRHSELAAMAANDLSAGPANIDLRRDFNSQVGTSFPNNADVGVSGRGPLVSALVRRASNIQ
jgi:hypothetical protein